MLVLKYGEINLILTLQIYGHLDVLFMKWQLSSHLLEQLTLKVYLEKYQLAFMKNYPNSILKN